MSANSPNHDDIADGIRSKIADGVLPLGAQIPDTRTLATEYPATTRTILRSIDLLTQEGYVYSTPGGATSVVRQTPREFAPRVIDALSSGKPLSISDAAALELLLQEHSCNIENSTGGTDR